MWIIHSHYESKDFFVSLERELLTLIQGEKNLIANLANISSWIYHAVPNLNWCGFYLWHEEEGELILGPFQGKPACIRIRPERGVCGASFRERKTFRVNDVHAFSDHIACDSSSRSELVIPLKKGNEVLGVLDLDSPSLQRFSNEDELELTRIMDLLTDKLY
jgi:L-methionine (R)-S-oxide reductase